MDGGKESLPNAPNLKRWNYDTSTNFSHDLKFNTMDPLQKPMRVNFDQMNYMMPQWEKVFYKTSKLNVKNKKINVVCSMCLILQNQCSYRQQSIMINSFNPNGCQILTKYQNQSLV